MIAGGNGGTHARVGFVMLLLMLAGGCGGPAGGAPVLTPTSSAPVSAVAQENAFAREYRRLHGVTDGGVLSTERATVAQIVGAVRSGYTGDVLLLPSTLPPGYALAAPFRGTGSGMPLSNPHTWRSGYAVTYTDGSGRLTLVVHPDEPLATGEWLATDSALDGRGLRVQERGGLVLVSTAPRDDDAQVIVIGERLARSEVLRVAAGLVSAE